MPITSVSVVPDFYCEECGTNITRDQYENIGMCDDCAGTGRYESNRMWRRGRSLPGYTFDRVASHRRFGVEIETSICHGWPKLDGKTRFGVKYDCTISGLEFDSPILQGDEGLTYIEDFCAFAAENRWHTDRYCGCHTHYDMRGESRESLFRIAYAYARTYPTWFACVHPERRDGEFSFRPSMSCADIRRASKESTFIDWCMYSDRYEYVNYNAYEDHGSMEIRLLEGSIDANVICNWITTHCLFMDWAKQHDFDELDALLPPSTRRQYRTIASVIGRYLADWLAARSREFDTPLRGPGSIKTDEFMTRLYWRYFLQNELDSRQRADMI